MKISLDLKYIQCLNLISVKLNTLGAYFVLKTYMCNLSQY